MKNMHHIPPLGKLRVLEQRALEAYQKGNFVTFAATFDYLGLTHADEDALEIGRADPAYRKARSRIDIQYSGNVGLTGGVRFDPHGFDSGR